MKRTTGLNGVFAIQLADRVGLGDRLKKAQMLENDAYEDLDARNLHEESIAEESATYFWYLALHKSPSRTAAKRCLREGGMSLTSLLRDKAVHPDEGPLPFGLSI